MFLPTYYISVLVVTLGGSTQFYSYDVVNPEQEVLTEWINATYFQRDGTVMDIAQLNVYWSIAVSAIAVGAIVGSLLTSYLAEKLGRRDALIANGAVNVFGALLEFFSKKLSSPEVFIAGRLVLGVNMGLSSGLVPMYLIEITPTRYRGAAGTMHQDLCYSKRARSWFKAAVAFSDWFSLMLGLPEVLGDKDNWQIAFGFPGILALLLCIVLPFCPESPKFSLLTRGRRDQAIRDLGRLVDAEEAKAMLDQLTREALSSQQSKGSYKELFTRPDLRFPLLIAVWMMVAQQFTGCAAVFAYSTDMFINAKLSPSVARFSTLGLGVGYFIFACCSAFLIERVGRRALSIFQLGSITIALASMILFTFIQNYTASVWISYCVIGSLTLYMCVYGVGSPIPWMINGEIFPTKFRSNAIAVSIFVSWFLLFVISLVYLPFKQLVGISISFVPFVIVSASSTCFVYFMLPETRNKHTDEIAEDIKERTKTVKFGERLRLLSFSAERRRYYSTSSSGASSLLDDSQLRYYRYMSLSKLSPNSSPPKRYEEDDYYLRESVQEMFYYLVATLILLAPWIFFIGMAMFPVQMDDGQSKSRKKGLCSSPGCIRCNRNKQELQLGKERFMKLFRSVDGYERIRDGLEESGNNESRINDQLFLELRFQTSRPIWDLAQLPSSVVKELRLLEASPKIARECDEALKNAYLWRRNEEPTTNSCWYTFSLVNQGEWQEDQCYCVPQLVAQLHQLKESMLLDCVFGNVFISMLPAGMQISEHCGITNARLRVHLGVEVPHNCEDTCFMVKLNWTNARCVIFDDSFPHYVSSKHCREDRVILSLDIWNPQLSSKEKDCLCRIFPPAVTA